MNRIEALIWLKENSSLFLVSQRLTNEQLVIIYDVYNAVTGEFKKPNSCGKCLKNTLDRLKVEYNKIKDSYIGYIYRTTKKKLTLNETKEIAYKFLIDNEEQLIERFEYLMEAEASVKQNIH